MLRIVASRSPSHSAASPSTGSHASMKTVHWRLAGAVTFLAACASPGNRQNAASVLLAASTCCRRSLLPLPPATSFVCCCRPCRPHLAPLLRLRPARLGARHHGLHHADVSHPKNLPGDAGRPRLPDHRCAPGMLLLGACVGLRSNAAAYLAGSDGVLRQACCTVPAHVGAAARNASSITLPSAGASPAGRQVCILLLAPCSYPAVLHTASPLPTAGGEGGDAGAVCGQVWGGCAAGGPHHHGLQSGAPDCVAGAQRHGPGAVVAAGGGHVLRRRVARSAPGTLCPPQQGPLPGGFGYSGGCWEGPRVLANSTGTNPPCTPPPPARPRPAAGRRTPLSRSLCSSPTRSRWA